MGKERMLIVSGTLPLHGTEEGGGRFAPSYASVAASLLYGASLEEQKNITFIGTPRVYKVPRYSSIPECKFNFIPVEDTVCPLELEYSKHISRACHANLGSSAVFPLDLQQSYIGYLEFNKKFLEVIIREYRAGDNIIVIGKHLLVLPRLIRESIPLAKITTLFISPFPSYDLFSCIPYSKEVLLALLSSDRIEFQSEEYCSNFTYTAFALVNAQNKEVLLSTLEKIKRTPNVLLSESQKKEENSEEIVKRFIPQNETRSIISLLSTSFTSIFSEDSELFSLSYLKEQKGTEEYLKDILPSQKALKKSKNNKAYVVYIGNLRSLLCTSEMYAPKELIRRILENNEFMEVKKRIEEAYGDKKIVVFIESTRGQGSPILYVESIYRYLQKYRKEEVQFIRMVLYGETSGGLHKRLPHLVETINCKFPNRISSVVFPDTLTYFAVLSSADVLLPCAPTDAFSLVVPEYLEIRKNPKILVPYSSGVCVPGATYTLNCSYAVAEALNSVLSSESAIEAQLKDTSEWMIKMKETLRAGTEIENTDKKTVETCRVIDKELSCSIRKSYNEANKRLILLDYDGTLTEIVPNPRDAKPTPEILSLLKGLTEDKRNKVFLVTGRGKEEAEEWFKEINIDIYAEHGAYKKEKGEWTSVPCDLSWINDAVKIINEYVEYTPGSHIEIKNTCVVFHCQDNGKWCANALHSMLKDRARVVSGRGIIEVRPINIDKGACVAKEYKVEDKDTFVLCAGDDLTDEDMFMYLIESPKVHSICVGERSTCASLRSNTPKELRALLEMLSTAPAPGA
ncbi:trehalose 6-phosphate synthase/phosphatase [Nematocida sp. LUAm3]|nr:trehalose 6-phosphate synthase/phosphatase [Nematocida sp. LUAm3]